MLKCKPINKNEVFIHTRYIQAKFNGKSINTLRKIIKK